jgi:hypothetical protein
LGFAATSPTQKELSLQQHSPKLHMITGSAYMIVAFEYFLVSHTNQQEICQVPIYARELYEPQQYPGMHGSNGMPDGQLSLYI